jgi:hypothetical protein
MYETRNETNRRQVACGESQIPNGLTFPFWGGIAGPCESIVVRLKGS